MISNIMGKPIICGRIFTASAGFMPSRCFVAGEGGLPADNRTFGVTKQVLFWFPYNQVKEFGSNI